MIRLSLLFTVLALASKQAAGQRLAPQILPAYPSNLAPLPALPVLPPSPYIPSLPPYVNVNPVVDYFAPIVDYQTYNSLSCGCNSYNYPPSCGCGAPSCGCGASPCGCGASPCGCGATIYECGVPTSVSLPPVVTPSCGCGVPLPTVPYSSYASPCGCSGLTTPLLPPLPPVIGCSKYLRQVCTQPPFL